MKIVVLKGSPQYSDEVPIMCKDTRKVGILNALGRGGGGLLQPHYI